MTRSTRHRTARAHRRPANRVRVRPRLEGLEDRCLLSVSITEFPAPTASSQPFWIAAGPDGNLWFTERLNDKIGEINPTTHAIAEFPVPTANALPDEITAGPDGNLWFAERVGKIGMINPATHAITEFPVPTAKALPEVISVGPDGNLWFIEADADKIGMINPTTHAIAEFSVPTASAGLTGITAGPDGNLWFTEQVGKIGMINPATHAITEFSIPTSNKHTSPSPWGITTGPDGNLWFADRGDDSIGVVTLNPASSAHLVVTQPPPASVTAGSGFGLTVQAEDSSGNLVSSFSGTITVGLASNPGGTSLGGTLRVAASGGVGTFAGLTLTKVASGYTLYVSASGPTSTTTTSFNVVSSLSGGALAATTATGPPDRLLAPLVLDSPDLWDGLRFKKRPRPVG